MHSSHNSDERMEIAERAYALWGAAGQPAGRDLEFWLQAETELEATRQGRSRKPDGPDTGHKRPPQKS
jgi:hypothetical protein